MTGVLERLEEAEQQLTPGPWKADGGALGAPGHGWVFQGTHRNTTGVNNAPLIALMRNNLPALLRVVRAAKKVAKYEQTYQAHKDDSDEEHPICSICESWLNRCEELDAALSALQEEPK